MPGKIATSEIVASWRGDVFDHKPGERDAIEERDGEYRLGGGVGTTSSVVWTKQESSRAKAKAFDEGEHPRDEHGRWTDGGGSDGGDGKPEGSEGKHPGEGYSKNAYIDKHGVIQTNNVYDAQLALSQDKKVELTQPKQVSTLIKLLGKTAAEMEAKGEKAPVFNLCNVSVSGTNLFCAESKGIPRVEMPVIPAKQTDKFVKFLERRLRLERQRARG